MRLRARIVLTTVLCASLSAALNAQTILSGALSDSSTGPLLSGSVYHVPSAIAVNAGATLTVQPGAVVKFAPNASFQIDGTLLVNGTGANPAYFTDLRDDTAGGDSNGDSNATSPANGSWIYMRFGPSSGASVVNRAVIRYGGGSGWSPVRLESAATVTNTIVEHAAGAAIALSSPSLQPVITGCTLRNNGGVPIAGLSFSSVANFASNRATGNSLDAMVIDTGTVPLDVAVNAAAGIDAVFALTTTVTLPAGRTLTFDPGVIVKFTGLHGFEVSGTLNTNGTVLRPVVITSIADDAYGGDTNGDGVSSATPGSWLYMRFYASSSASALNRAIVRYGGGLGWTPVRIQGSNLSMVSCTVEHAANHGISFGGAVAHAVIDLCTIRNNGGAAIAEALIESVPYLRRVSASGNGLDQLLVTAGPLNEDVYIDGNNGIDASGGSQPAVVVQGTLSVSSGRTLTLGPGALFKFNAGGGVDVHGSLVVRGTEAKPVLFTDRRDDSVGGDSDGPGGSPAPGGWFRVYVQSWATLVDTEHLTMRYSGLNGFSSFVSLAPTVVFNGCRIERAAGAGFELHDAGQADFLTAWNCASTGIVLIGGSFDVRHATVADCPTGIARSGAGWTGELFNGIAFWNTTDFGTGMSTTNVRFSDGMAGGLGNIFTDPQFVNRSAGDLRLLATSPCIGTGDSIVPLDNDCTQADMGAYPSLGGAAPATYCTGKQSSAGCVPFMASSGYASPTVGLPFPLRAFNVLNQKNGLIYYGLNGPASAPFQGGTKCVAPPVVRLPLMLSGGNTNGSDCSGVYEFDFNAYIQTGADAGLVPGASVHAQCWYRDPGVNSGTGLSNGIAFDVCN